MAQYIMTEYQQKGINIDPYITVNKFYKAEKYHHEYCDDVFVILDDVGTRLIVAIDKPSHHLDEVGEFHLYERSIIHG